jgi:putative heme transporter
MPSRESPDDPRADPTRQANVCSRRAVRVVRRVVTTLLVVSILVAIYVHRVELRAAMKHMGSLSIGWTLALLGVFGLSMLTQGFALQSYTPGLTLRQSWMVQESATAATNTIVGSGPVSTGVRIAMMRSWHVTDRAVGVSVVAQNVIAAFAVWTIAFLTAMAGVAGATKNVVDRRIFLAVFAAAIVMLAGSVLFWLVLLFHPAPTRWIARLAQRILRRLNRRWNQIPNINLVGIVETGRADARALLNSRGRRMLLATAFDQIVTLAKPVMVVRAFGISSSVLPTTTILVSWGLVRLAGALSPLPGGLGVTDVGLAALLTRFGGPERTVLAAVLTYRVLTFVLPMVIGGLCLMWWRWHRSPDPQPATRPDLVLVSSEGSLPDPA